MKPVAFAEQNVVFGQGQEEYQPLPAHRGEPPESNITTCWQLDRADMAELQRNGGRIWLQQLTFGGQLQPQLLSVSKPAHIQADFFESGPQ